MDPNINEWESVLMFRCVQDPMIGPKPRNAFMITETDNPGWKAWFNTHTGSVYVEVPTPKGTRRHIVPTGNLSSVELVKQEDHGTIQNSRGAAKKKNEIQAQQNG